ncbi:MAG: 4-hydroxybenzoate octaprenyltransferase [Bacteroidetes bacterium]|nr:4-hydroxybenzoate octaprenyltransferase [Bacteroidota bacterium]
MSAVRNYLSLIKFSHTIFAMPFAVIGFFLGVKNTNSELNWKLLGLVILCMIFARSAAMAFNRWADNKFDKENIRTKIRELPSGIISEKNTLVFVIINCVLFIVTTFFINQICFYLSPVALLVILGYSYTKRFTPLCHLILGLGLSLAPIGAFLAVTEEFKLLPLLYSFVVLFWVSGFDIIYALQDEEFDHSQNLKSIPVLMGKKNALLFSRILHLISASLVLFAGYYAGFHLCYWIGAGIFISLLIYQHTLVKPNDLRKVNLAFATMNGIASVVFAIFFLLEIYF